MQAATNLVRRNLDYNRIFLLDTETNDKISAIYWLT